MFDNKYRNIVHCNYVRVFVQLNGIKRFTGVYVSAFAWRMIFQVLFRLITEERLMFAECRARNFVLGIGGDCFRKVIFSMMLVF